MYSSCAAATSAGANLHGSDHAFSALGRLIWTVDKGLHLLLLALGVLRAGIHFSTMQDDDGVSLEASDAALGSADRWELAKKLWTAVEETAQVLAPPASSSTGLGLHSLLHLDRILHRGRGSG